MEADIGSGLLRPYLRDDVTAAAKDAVNLEVHGRAEWDEDRRRPGTHRQTAIRESDGSGERRIRHRAIRERAQHRRRVAGKG